MLESIMEELIANYPEDFFPRKIFTLTGRQGVFSGVGRFDLLFKDEHQTNILMELKARPAKYEDASQLAKYLDALKIQGERDIIMWLVATIIPSSVREFLDRIGIEYTEIHESEYRAIALKHNITIENANEITKQDFPVLKTKIERIINRTSNQSSSNHKSIIKPKFRQSIDLLKNTFPAAYDFIYSIIESSEGFYFYSDTNAHLYYKNSFLAYVLPSILPSNSIKFSPKFHIQIEKGTVDRNGLVFPEIFEKLTKATDGTRFTWANYEGRGRSYIIKNEAPPDFFSNLLVEIKKEHLKLFGE